jgi:hypothetical protein
LVFTLIMEEKIGITKMFPYQPITDHLASVHL